MAHSAEGLFEHPAWNGAGNGALRFASRRLRSALRGSGRRRCPALSNSTQDGWTTGFDPRRSPSIPQRTVRPAAEWSGKRGSNPPPQPWQGCALPNELLPRTKFIINSNFSLVNTFIPTFLKKTRCWQHKKQALGIKAKRCPRFLRPARLKRSTWRRAWRASMSKFISRSLAVPVYALLILHSPLHLSPSFLPREPAFALVHRTDYQYCDDQQKHQDNCSDYQIKEP